MHEDSTVKSLISTLLYGDDICIPSTGGEIHFDQDWTQERANQIANSRLDNCQMHISMRLSGEENIRGHGCRLASVEDKTYQQPRIHERVIDCGKTNYGESKSRDHEEALDLNEDVMLPFCVVVEKNLGVKRGAGDKEDQGNRQIGDYDLLRGLLRFWHLNLRRDDGDEDDADQKPLILDKPQQEMRQLGQRRRLFFGSRIRRGRFFSFCHFESLDIELAR